MSAALYGLQGISSLIGAFGQMGLAESAAGTAESTAERLYAARDKQATAVAEQGFLNREANVAKYAASGVSVGQPGDSPWMVYRQETQMMYRNALVAAQEYENYAEYYIAQQRLSYEKHMISAYSNIASAGTNFVGALGGLHATGTAAMEADAAASNTGAASKPVINRPRAQTPGEYYEWAGYGPSEQV